jgi:hypothetical protein
VRWARPAKTGWPRRPRRSPGPGRCRNGAPRSRGGSRGRPRSHRRGAVGRSPPPARRSVRRGRRRSPRGPRPGRARRPSPVGVGIGRDPRCAQRHERVGPAGLVGEGAVLVRHRRHRLRGPLDRRGDQGALVGGGQLGVQPEAPVVVVGPREPSALLDGPARSQGGRRRLPLGGSPRWRPAPPRHPTRTCVRCQSSCGVQREWVETPGSG